MRFWKQWSKVRAAAETRISAAAGKKLAQSRQRRLVPPQSGQFLEPLESRQLLAVEPAGVEFEIPTAVSGSQTTMVDPTFSGSERNAWQSVASDSVGNFVVVWTDESDFLRGHEVKLQRFNQAGVKQGGEVKVNAFASGNQNNAAVAMAGDGRFVVTWTSQNQDGSGLAVVAQRFDAAGVKQGKEFVVNQTTTSDQRKSTVSMGAEGSFVIAWESALQDGSDTGVFAQQFAADGTPVGSELAVNQITAGRQQSPAITLDGQGRWFVAWESQNVDKSGFGIAARRFGADGQPLGDEFVVNTFTDGDQRSPVVASTPTGDVVIAWQSQDQDSVGGSGIYARGLDITNQQRFADILVNKVTAGEQLNPALAMRASGSFVINWSSRGEDTPSAATEYGVYAQNFQPLGVPDDEVYLVNTTTAGNQRYGAVTMDGQGDLVHVWSAFTAQPAGVSWGVFGQRYASNQPPVLSTGGPYEVAEGDALQLDGSASFDPNGDPLLLQWDINGDGNFGDATGSVPNLPWNVFRQLTINGLPANDGPSAIAKLQLRGSDDGGQTWSVSAPTEFRIRNTPPTVTVAGNGQVEEGSVYTLELVEVSDPGQDTVTEYRIDWGDGTPATVATKLGSYNHTYADGARILGTQRQIQISALDEDGEHLKVATKNVLVTDRAPQVVLQGNATADEGAAYTVTLGPVTDPGQDVITEFRLDWGDGTQTTVNKLGTVTHNYADGLANRQIKLSVVNDDGLFANIAQLNVEVQDVAPTIRLIGASQTNEGDLYTLELREVVDPGQDTVSKLEVDWGDGTLETARLGLLSHVYADGDATVNIRVRMTNEDGTFQSASLPVQVANVKPRIQLSSNASAPEGSTYALTLGSITDPAGTLDRVTQYLVYWGDSLEPQAFANGGTVLHRYANGNATYNIRVDLVDEDGTHQNAGALTVNVLDVPPIVEVAGANSVEEGSEYALELVELVDPGREAASLYTIRWGDGSSSTTTQLGTVTHRYADNSNSVQIEVDVTTGEGTFLAVGKKTIQVLNVNPRLFVSGAATVVSGKSYGFGLDRVEDPGQDRVSEYRITWGDGSPTELHDSLGSKPHAYASVNARVTRTINVTLVDEDGLYANAASLRVDVLPSILGDANRDGVVDITDFIAVRRSFGSAGSWADGDFTGDGRIDIQDFIILRSNFGSRAGGAAPDQLGAVAPQTASGGESHALTTAAAFAQAVHEVLENGPESRRRRGS